MLQNLYLICGKSGSGRTTIVNTLSDKYGYKVLQSHTTRKPRHPNDKDHIYSTISDYMDAQCNNTIIASTVFDHNYYWATRNQLESSDLYVINNEGIESLKHNYHGDKTLVVIYIDVHSEECIERMKLRGDKDAAILERLKNDVQAFSGIEQIADVIVDGSQSVEQVVQIIQEIITKCERYSYNK